MNAGDGAGSSGGYRSLADRFTEKYEADGLFWNQVEDKWRQDSEENRIQLAPIERNIEYGDRDGSDRLTVSWRDGSAILVMFLGTEDETWDFIDGQGRIRGYRFDAGR